MSLQLFGAVLRFYHTSPKLLVDKYIARLKQRAEQSCKLFEKKKGRALILADYEPSSVLRLASASSSSIIKDQPNPHLSLKASQRVAFALHQLVRQTTANVLTKFGIHDQIQIINIDFHEGISQIKLTWKMATSAPSLPVDIDSQLKKLADALSNEIVDLQITSVPPVVSFCEFSKNRTNADNVNALLKNCDLGPDSFSKNGSAEGLPIRPPKSKESLRDLVNHDFGAMTVSENNFVNEQHTFHIRTRGKSNTPYEANVYGLDRDAIMAKVSSSRRKS